MQHTKQAQAAHNQGQVHRSPPTLTSLRFTLTLVNYTCWELVHFTSRIVLTINKMAASQSTTFILMHHSAHSSCMRPRHGRFDCSMICRVATPHSENNTSHQTVNSCQFPHHHKTRPHHHLFTPILHTQATLSKEHYSNTVHRELFTESCPQRAVHRVLSTESCLQRAVHRELPTDSCLQRADTQCTFHLTQTLTSASLLLCNRSDTA